MLFQTTFLSQKKHSGAVEELVFCKSCQKWTESLLTVTKWTKNHYLWGSTAIAARKIVFVYIIVLISQNLSYQQSSLKVSKCGKCFVFFCFWQQYKMVCIDPAQNFNRNIAHNWCVKFRRISLLYLCPVIVSTFAIQLSFYFYVKVCVFMMKEKVLGFEILCQWELNSTMFWAALAKRIVR